VKKISEKAEVSQLSAYLFTNKNDAGYVRELGGI